MFSISVLYFETISCLFCPRILLFGHIFFKLLQALFDVDEVYTLEERIKQDELNGESLGTRKKKKKKKKNTTCQNELPSETLKVEAVDKSLPALEKASCCEEEMQESLDDQPITDNQSGRESTVVCKKGDPLLDTSCKDVTFVDCYATLSDLPTGSTEYESLAPSAEALSTALQAAAFSVGQVAGSTEPETVHLACVNDNTEHISEGDISSVTANVEINNEDGTDKTQQSVNFTEVNSTNNVDNYKDGGNCDNSNVNLTDLKSSPSKISEPDIIYAEITENEKRTFDDALNEDRGSKTAMMSTLMNDNSDVTEVDILSANEDIYGIELERKENMEKSVRSANNINCCMMQFEEVGNVKHPCTSKECGENIERNTNSETTVQETSLFDSKANIPNVSITGECTENVEFTGNLNQAENIINEAHLQRHVVGTNEMVEHQVSRCENTQAVETAHSFTAVHMKDESVEIADTERSYCLQSNGGFSHDEKCSLQSQQTNVELYYREKNELREDCLNLVTHPVGKENRTIDISSHADLPTDSSRFPLVYAKEDRCISPNVEARTFPMELDGSVTVIDVQRHVSETVSNESDKGDDASLDGLEHLVVGTPQVTITAANNFYSLAEEKKLPLYFVSSESANDILDERVNGSESQSKMNETAPIDAQCSGSRLNSRKALSQSEEFHLSGNSFQEGKENRHFWGDKSGRQIDEHSSNANEQSRNVKANGLQLGTSQIVQELSEVEETYSDQKEREVLDKPDELEKPGGNSLPCEKRAKDTLDAITTLKNKTESSIDNLVNPPGKETQNDVKSESGTLDLSQKGLNSEERTMDENRETPCIKGTEGACSSIKTDGQTKGEMDNSLLNTVGESAKKWEGEDEREEGEISSDEDEPPACGKHTKEEKEEGELSSSASEAEAAVETSIVKKCGANFGEGSQTKNIVEREEARRRHSSQLLESSTGKRRPSSSVLQNIDLRTKLREVRKKPRISLKSKTPCSRETKTDRPLGGSQSVDKAMKKNGSAEKRSDKPSKGKERYQGKDKQPGTRDGGEKPRRSSQLIRSKTQEHPQESSKEGQHASNQSRREKARTNSHSVSKTTRKPNGSSRGDKKMKEKSPRRDKIEDRPGKGQCDAKKAVKEPPAPREIDGKTFLKSLDTVPQQDTKMKESNTKAKLDCTDVEKKAKKMTKDSLAVTRSKAKSRTCSNSNKQKGLPVVKNKSECRTTANLASERSVERCINANSENESAIKNGNFQTHPLASGKKNDKGNKQTSITHLSAQCKEENKLGKLSNVKIGTKTIGASDVTKGGHTGKSKTGQAKTALKVSPRIAVRKGLKKSPASIASKTKAKSGSGNETRLGNPRKRSRSTDSTDTRQGKKLRLQEKIDSSPKLPTGSSTTQMARCNSNNQPPCSTKTKDSGNKMAPVRDEKIIKIAAENKCVDNSKEISSEIDCMKAKPILIGRNKCLVFKRRHVNQLFVRGDNVVMIAYDKLN